MINRPVAIDEKRMVEEVESIFEQYSVELEFETWPETDGEELCVGVKFRQGTFYLYLCEQDGEVCLTDNDLVEPLSEEAAWRHLFYEALKYVE